MTVLGTIALVGMLLVAIQVRNEFDKCISPISSVVTIVEAREMGYI